MYHPNRDGSRDRNDTIAGERADTDEEVQLLHREELEFEDYSPTPGLHQRSRRPGLWNFLSGPSPPRIQNIKPYFPSVDEAPLKLLNPWLPQRNQQIFFFVGPLMLWAIVFSGFLTSQLPITDADGKNVLNLDCVDTLWKRKNECGIDGLDCRPFSNHSFAFRCPAKCESVQILNPHAVGPLDVNYRPLVVGSSIYRGDSFLCGSAIHSGVVDASRGGCGRVTLEGEHDQFESTEQHGIESIPFDSYFPLSFSISIDNSVRCRSDPRGPLLLVSIFFTSILSLFSTSPRIFFPIFTLIFAHVSFVSDPPTASYRNITMLPDHISMFAKRLLPAFFVVVILYRTIIKRTLSGLTNQWGKTVLWLGGFWFGALSNYTFDWIPISRLTAHDLEQQPGAKFALAMILLILVLIIAGQVFFFWLEGRLLRYLGLYGLFILGILICLAIPGVNLRIHHYIIGLLLLPGTNVQTRISLLYQGILLGLFINGIARWDFDSILQTSAALRGDAKFGMAIPTMTEPVISYTGEGLLAAFSWDMHPEGVDGISVLVNDVERNRAFFDDGLDGEFDGFEWTRPIEQELNEYFRFAYVKDGRTLDYSKPGTLFINGTWAMEGDS